MGKQSGAGRLVAIFTIFAMKYGGDCKPLSNLGLWYFTNTLRRIKEGENDQLEQHSTARNGFLYGDNKGKKFDHEEHYQTLNELPVISNER